MCSIARLSATNPRSFCLFASGRVLPASVTNLLSSTVWVIRIGAPLCACAMGPARTKREARIRVAKIGVKKLNEGSRAGRVRRMGHSVAEQEL